MAALPLLIFCLLFGLIHLFTGLVIKGFQLGKQKDYVGVISDVVSWMLFILGVPGEIIVVLSIRFSRKRLRRENSDET